MDIEVEVGNQVAFVTLNRPAVLNALSFAMIGELRRVLEAAAARIDVRAVLLRGAGGRAFCAGGDIRALYDSYRTDGTLHRDFFVEEYRLDYFLHRFPKPLVALLDGVVMGGGMGLGQAAPLRLVGERTRMAMPEVGIGLVPDVGGSFFLSRLPGALGVYLALTGTEIRAADAIYTGLADCYVAADAAAAIEPALRTVQWGGDARSDVERALRALATDPGTAPLEPLRAAIDRHFSCASVAGILASLRAETDPGLAPWARDGGTTAAVDACFRDPYPPGQHPLARLSGD